ncbi:hypothetical protein AAVH_13972 [Aphelenchoides avenae]|nr:hypothetical protein AAVH_13972 [Aphelenchus avenae]
MPDTQNVDKKALLSYLKAEAADGAVERTTVSYSSVTPIFYRVPHSWRPSSSIRRAPQKKINIAALPLIDTEDLRMAQEQLVRNLQDYFRKENDRYRKKLERDLEMDRLLALSRTREDYLARNKTTGYCEQFSTCSDELKYLKKKCRAKQEQILENLPKRKFINCQDKFIVDFQSVESLKEQAEEAFENCLVEQIALGQATVADNCPADWPVLSSPDIRATCTERIKTVEDHCKKLGRCCSSLQTCRKTVEETPLVKELTARRFELVSTAPECKVNPKDAFLRYREAAEARDASNSHVFNQNVQTALQTGIQRALSVSRSRL